MQIPVEKPKRATKAQIEKMLDDPLWGMAEKQDGNRVILQGDGSGRQWLINKLGQTQKISKVNSTPLKLKAAEALLNIGVSYIFDGEAIGGRNNWKQYVIFNVIEFNGNDWTQATQAKREIFLQTLAEDLSLPYTMEPSTYSKSPLVLLRTIISPPLKRAFYDRLKARIPVSEGVIFRKMWAQQMTDGYSNSICKAPFIQELDVVAYKWHGGSTSGTGRGGSVGIALYHRGELKSIGGLRSGLSYDRLDQCQEQIGDNGELLVMRVRFLGKRTIGVLLNQPRCVEIRDDKLPDQCTSDQLIELLGPDREKKFDKAKSIRR